MPVPADHYRVVYGFALGGDGEVAQTGFYARFTHAESVSINAQLLAEWGNSAWVSGFGDLEAYFSTGVVLDSVKVYHLVASGPSDGIGEDHVGSGTWTDWAGTDANSMPWETSLVATLEAQPAGTRVAHPRRYRGRMYLPPLRASLAAGAAGLIPDANRTALLNAVSDTLEAFNDVVPGTGSQARVVVFSRVNGSSTDVDHVSMDNQFDVQRRRENRQAGVNRVQHAALDA